MGRFAAWRLSPYCPSCRVCSHGQACYGLALAVTSTIHDTEHKWSKGAVGERVGNQGYLAVHPCCQSYVELQAQEADTPACARTRHTATNTAASASEQVLVAPSVTFAWSLDAPRTSCNAVPQPACCRPHLLNFGSTAQIEHTDATSKAATKRT